MQEKDPDTGAIQETEATLEINEAILETEVEEPETGGEIQEADLEKEMETMPDRQDSIGLIARIETETREHHQGVL
jgi:hypothetical protein